MSTKQNKRLIHVIWVTLYKIMDEREDCEATFQFLEEIQNCPDLWDVLAAAYKDTKKECVVRSKGGISTDIYTISSKSFYFFQRSLFLLRRLTYKQQLYVSAMALRRPCCKLPCAEIKHEFDVWTHEFANFLKFPNTSLPT